MHATSNVRALLVDEPPNLARLGEAFAVYAGQVLYEAVEADLRHGSANPFEAVF